LIARDPGFATTHQWHGTNLLIAGFVEETVAAYRTGIERAAAAGNRLVGILGRTCGRSSRQATCRRRRMRRNARERVVGRGCGDASAAAVAQAMKLQ